MPLPAKLVVAIGLAAAALLVSADIKTPQNDLTMSLAMQVENGAWKYQP